MTGSGIVESLGVVGRVSGVMEVGGWKPDMKTASRTLIEELQMEYFLKVGVGNFVRSVRSWLL